jgi:uncharacterized protein (DUF2267 family)
MASKSTRTTARKGRAKKAAPAKLTGFSPAYWEKKATDEANYTLTCNVDDAERDAARMVLVFNNQSTTQTAHDALTVAIQRLATYTGVTVASSSVIAESYPRMVASLQAGELYEDESEAMDAHKSVLEILALTEAGHQLPNEQREQSSLPLDYSQEAEHIIKALEHEETPDRFKYFLQEFMSRLVREYGIIRPSQRADDCFEFSPAAIRALYPLLRQMDGGGQGVVELINTAAWLMDGDTPDHLVGFIEQKGGQG